MWNAKTKINININYYLKKMYYYKLGYNKNKYSAKYYIVYQNISNNKHSKYSD